MKAFILAAGVSRRLYPHTYNTPKCLLKVGNKCIIAGEVGFGGSSSIGDHVMIGGQAGVSGHLKIGNNVHIGGGSGVINDISDNTKVMGYPAKNLREFIKDNR